MGPKQVNPGKPIEVDNSIAALMTKYKQLFEELMKLPPHRSQDHRIPLMEGTRPVTIKLYWHSAL